MTRTATPSRARRRRAAAAAALVLVGAVLGAPVAADALVPPISVTAVALDPSDPARDRVGRLHYRGGLRLDGEGVGGLSAMVADGTGALIVLSDTGHWLLLRPVLDLEGRLIDVRPEDAGSLIAPDGTLLAGKRDVDAEGMARLADGSLVVAFERNHRLLRYPHSPGSPFAVPPVEIPLPPGAQALWHNGGIEALAALPGDRLLAVPETFLFVSETPFAWVGGVDGTSWRSVPYDWRAPFAASDATALPNGDIVLLERMTSLRPGIYRTRVVLVPEARITAGEVAGTELARLEPPLAQDNLEGITAAPGRAGETLLYVVADDNFSRRQNNLLLAFAFAPPRPPVLPLPKPEPPD